MDSRLSETGVPIAQDPCKPELNPERGVSRAREAKRKGVPIDRSRGIVEGHSKRPRPVFKLILGGQSPTQSSIMRMTDQGTDRGSLVRERARCKSSGSSLHRSGLPVAEKPVSLMGDDESRRVKDALSAFCLDVILSLLHHLAPMATNYEAHVAYTSFTYFVSYRLNVWVNPSIAENKEVGRRDKRRRNPLVTPTRSTSCPYFYQFRWIAKDLNSQTVRGVCSARADRIFNLSWFRSLCFCALSRSGYILIAYLHSDTLGRERQQGKRELKRLRRVLTADFKKILPVFSLAVTGCTISRNSRSILPDRARSRRLEPVVGSIEVSPCPGELMLHPYYIPERKTRPRGGTIEATEEDRSRRTARPFCL
ncbi:hypothetical protein ALC62_09599 [Cyphomyrmex costatus]|uniref:Uncharacterized protein n=1 Tax=Cyphomyrmex costatus TaxID=456900 RepID=A0A151IFF6_9HYME|nr:hypothetical protein ALC62_09599 [Cyphomyrmex costatus]